LQQFDQAFLRARTGSSAATFLSSWAFTAAETEPKKVDMRTLYTAVSTAHGGRDGHVRSSDGVVDLDLRRRRRCAGRVAPGRTPSSSSPLDTWRANATRGNIDVKLVAD
jgi:hypothetical protein